MADIRGRTVCTLGTVISGSFSSSSIIGSGVMTVSGSLVLHGPASFKTGTTFSLSFISHKSKRSIPLGYSFYVLSSAYSVNDNTTTVTFTDILGLVSENETLPIYIYPANRLGEIDPETDQPYTELQRLFLQTPISSTSICLKLLSLLNLSAPPITDFKFLEDKFEISGNVLSYLNDFAISANKIYHSIGQQASLQDLNSPGKYVVVLDDDILDMQTTSSTVRGAQVALAKYKKLTIKDEDIEPEEQLGLDKEEGEAYCTKNVTCATPTIQYYDYEVFYNNGSKAILTHIEEVPNKGTEKTCYDSLGREVSYVQRVQGMYGDTVTIRTTTWSRGVLGKKSDNIRLSASPVGGCGSGINLKLSSQEDNLSRLFKAWKKERLKIAKENAEKISDTEVLDYNANPLLYTFGTEDPYEYAPDVFKWESSSSTTTVTEPIPIIIESANLPRDAFLGRPLIPPTYRDYSGVDTKTFISSKTIESTYNSGSYSSTTTTSYKAAYLTTSGARAIANYLKIFQTDPEGNVTGQWYNPIWGVIKKEIARKSSELVLDSRSHSVQEKKLDLSAIVDDIDQAQSSSGTRPLLQSISETEELEFNVPGAQEVQLVYSPPYSDDDGVSIRAVTPLGTLYQAVKGASEQQAREYARTQNKLRLSKSNGMSVTLPVKYLSIQPMTKVCLPLGRLGAYTVDTFNVSFDNSGAVVTYDLLYDGVAV